MFPLSDHSRESDAQTQQIKADIQAIYDHIPLNERLYVTIHGANHFTFSDDGALLKSHVVRGVLRAAGKLGMMETASSP
jgi:predicted dienelactone hydrolase